MKMNKHNTIKNPDSDQFDKDIIQKHSYNIIKENSISNYKNNSMFNDSSNYISEYSNNNDTFNNDEDNDLNSNININNYLSKQNSNKKNIQKVKNLKNMGKKNNTGNLKNMMFRKISNNYKKNNNTSFPRDSNDVLKSKLLERIRQQKEALNAYNNKSNIDKKINSLNITKNEENGKIKNEKTEINDKSEEESKNVPKILTFLRTFKNFAKPFKSNTLNNDNDNNEKEDNSIDNYNINDYNYNDNFNNTCFNFKPKIKARLGKINLNKRKKNNFSNKFYTDQKEINITQSRNERKGVGEVVGDDFIDYNRFTFRNNISEDSNPTYKTIDVMRNKNSLFDYNHKNFNPENINNRNNNNRDNIRNIYRNNKFLGEKNLNSNKNNKIKIERISPEFKKRRNSKKNIYKNLYKNFFSDIFDDKPYRNNDFRNKYSSPEPLPKAKIKYNKFSNCYTFNNIPKKKINIPSIDDYNSYNYNNDNEDSFQSLNMSARYRKPKINDSFQRNNNTNMKHMSKFNNIYDISEDRIKLPKNAYTSERPLKFMNPNNNKIHEIVINMNDSFDSLNSEPYYNTNNCFHSNRGQLKQKILNLKSNSNNMKRSPLSLKQNGGVYDFSDNYESSQYEDEEDSVKNKKLSNFARFMEPFRKNDNKKWYNEDSYYSFDIVNMNKNAQNKHLLYQKPLKSNNSNKNINKNNSMYVKRIVPYNIKKKPHSKGDMNFNKMNNSVIHNNDKYKKDFEDNVYDFDAPKAIKDTSEDIFSISNSNSNRNSNINNNGDYVNDTSRENQLTLNSDINTNKLNYSLSNTSSIQNNKNINDNNNNDNKNNNLNNNNINPNLSERTKLAKNKIVYMKKLNTVYNFYKGTKKLFSKINDKLFQSHKKSQIKSDNINDIDININNNKKNDGILSKGIITPSMLIGDKDNIIPSFSARNSETSSVDEDYIQKKEKEQKDQNDYKYINKKIINKKKCFKWKFYDYYLPPINKKSDGYYFYKTRNNNEFKIPIKKKCYMTKENINIYKIPNISKCYIEKSYVIINDNCKSEHQQFISFFSIGDNNNYNDNNTESHNKNNSNGKQFSILSSNNINDSFSFKNNHNNSNIINSNNDKNQSDEKIKINNFHFSLSPKKDINKFEIEKIKPEKNNNIIIINDKEEKGNTNKKNTISDNNFISPVKDNKKSNNNNKLPQDVNDNSANLNNITETVQFPIPSPSRENDEDINNDKQPDKDNNKNRIKLKKDELMKIIKKYMTPEKKAELQKKLDKNLIMEKKKEMSPCQNINEENSCSSDSKIKTEKIPNDSLKEKEQEEKYITDLKKKMEENKKNNDIIYLLNILTDNNFNEIVKKIINLTTKENDELLPDKDIINNEYILIKIIHDKAMIEPKFINLYSKLCSELYNKLNDIKSGDINFQNILMEECNKPLNQLNNIDCENNSGDKNNIKLDDENIFLNKKKFLGNVDFICELINKNILTQDFGFNYLEELYKKYKDNEKEKFKKNLCLEAIVNLLSKFGKKINSNKNKNSNNIKYYNDFINNKINPILKDENLPNFLKYKIINIIEDSKLENSILAKKTKKLRKQNFSLNKSHKSRKRKHGSLSIDNSSLNKTAIENNLTYATYRKINNDESKNDNISSINMIKKNNNNEDIIKLIGKDLDNYGNFLNENNIKNKSQLYNNHKIGNEYDWSQIEDIILQNKKDLGEIIRCYVEVCIDKITNNEKIFIANDYIKNIINYYSTNLTNKEKDIIHNKMINLFKNIHDICIDNFNMKEIMGYLLFILIENKLFFIKDLNKFIGMDTEIIKTIAEVIKYTIISSEVKSKKYHNNFKQTKLFVDNDIFNEQVTNKIQDIIK